MNAKPFDIMPDSSVFLHLPPGISCNGRVGAGLQQQRFSGLHQRGVTHRFDFVLIGIS